MKYIVVFVLLIFVRPALFAQSETFRESSGWGIREHQLVIIPPVYDTIFNFDSTGMVCLACTKSKTSASSQFIKVNSTSFKCRYLNKKNEKLSISVPGNDTCSIFGLNKNTLKQFNNTDQVFIVSVKGKKHLVAKNFRQLSRKGYHELKKSEAPDYYLAGTLSEADEVLWGIITANETEIIPPRYTHLKINTTDSMIIGCGAGLPNSEDGIYDYQGKRLYGFKRHVDQATKKYVIHKIFEPKEYFILNNLETLEEKQLNVNEIKAGPNGSEILMRIKNNWYLYNINSHEKKPFKPS